MDWFIDFDHPFSKGVNTLKPTQYDWSDIPVSPTQWYELTKNKSIEEILKTIEDLKKKR